MTQLTLVAGADPRILKTEDLLRYGKPETALEQALYDALRAERQDAEPWKELATNYDCDTPAELKKLIEELNENQKGEKEEALEAFFESVAESYAMTEGQCRYEWDNADDVAVGVNANLRQYRQVVDAYLEFHKAFDDIEVDS